MKFKALIIILLWGTAFSQAQTVNFTATESCHGDPTLLSGSSTFSDPDIASWNWDLDNDGAYDDASGKNINFLFAQAGNHNVGLKIIPNSGTPDSITKQVTVNPLPQVNFHADNLCEGKTAVYTDQSAVIPGSIMQYYWDFDNDGIVDDISGPIVTYTCGPAQVYTTKLECISDKGCKGFSTKVTEVFPQPEADFTAISSCKGDSVIFNNESNLVNDSILYYLWDFGDGNQSVSPGNPVHVYNIPGNYNPGLIAVSNNNCKDTVSHGISIFDPGIVEFQYTGDTVLEEGSEITITANSSSADTYSWSTGASSSSITVGDSGEYSVTVTDINGCKFSTQTYIGKKPSITTGLYSNVLTPNGDGVNDVVLITEPNCVLSVYNIWGDAVYSSNNYQNDWDGTTNGKPLDAGSYYYILKCEGEEIIGNLNILR